MVIRVLLFTSMSWQHDAQDWAGDYVLSFLLSSPLPTKKGEHWRVALGKIVHCAAGIVRQSVVLA